MQINTSLLAWTELFSRKDMPIGGKLLYLQTAPGINKCALPISGQNLTLDNMLPSLPETSKFFVQLRNLPQIISALADLAMDQPQKVGVENLLHCQCEI